MNKTIKNIFRTVYYFPSTAINLLQYKLFHVRVGKKHETKGILYIRNKGHISIGQRVRINSKATANPIGEGDRTYFQVFSGGVLTIGDDTRLSNCAISVAERVSIGNHVRIGAGVKIFDTDFHSVDPYERTKSPEGKPVSKPVCIHDYSFIGAGVHILKGVEIGQNAVIGAAAVVTKNVPAGELWAGNPAKKIGNTVK